MAISALSPVRGRFLPSWIAVAGIALLVLAFGWWWLVFSQLVTASAMPLSEALPCLAVKSDVCSLAEMLCSKPHWLAIKRYSSEPFWMGLAFLLTVLLSKIAGRTRV
jgi:hypothetical protein